MNRPTTHAIQDIDAAAMPRMVAQVEERLAKLLLPAAAVVAIMLFFSVIYGMVDDLLVAGVIAMVVPMMFLPLLRREGVS